MLRLVLLTAVTVPPWLGMLWAVVFIIFPEWQEGQSADTELDTTTANPYTDPIS